MLLVDTSAGRIVSDEEIKHQLASEHPYRDWLNKYQVRLQESPTRSRRTCHGRDPARLIEHQQAFGYTAEDLGCCGSDGPERHRAAGLHGQ